VFRAAGLAEAAVEEVCGGDYKTARDDERGVCGIGFFDHRVCEDDEEKSGGKGYERQRTMVVAQVCGQERDCADDDGDAEHKEFDAFIAEPRDADERQHAEQDGHDRAVNGAGAGCQHAEAVERFRCSGSSGFQVKSPMKIGWWQFNFLTRVVKAADSPQRRNIYAEERRELNCFLRASLRLYSVPAAVNSYFLKESQCVNDPHAAPDFRCEFFDE